MRTRFIYFIVFQIIAWTFYFNWDYSTVQKPEFSQKLIKVAEISPSYVTNEIRKDQNYELILRNDGFFTRLYTDQTQENGLWKINYEGPSIILTSPQGEYHYRILEQENDRILVRLIQSNELARKEDEMKRNQLFSSTSLN
jgi:hypothetical protein